MRTLIRRRDAGPRADPAPSRAAYRLTRLWLSPFFRRLVTRWLPAAAVAGALAGWAVQPAQQAMFGTWAAQVRASVEARPEFQIRQMAITGASPVLADAIRDRLDLDFPLSWFRLDPQAVHDTVVAFDAVQSADVTLELGGALRVAVTQRQPAVIWRHRGGLEILDETGHRIGFIARRDGRADLPLVTGEGADAAIPEALALIAAAAPLGDRVLALTRQGARRWDVMLDRGQVMMLPESDPVTALERVLAMARAQDLLERDIAAVDLRLPDRPTIRLGPAAMDYLRLTRAFQQDLAQP